jgi:uncharacterized membrane protein (DUF485 family)
MLHEPAVDAGEDHAAEYKKILGVKMFIVYALIYVGFVAVNVISPILMETEIVFGLNLAVTYGFGLIILALIMALIYNSMCNRKEAEFGDDAVEEEGK